MKNLILFLVVVVFCSCSCSCSNDDTSVTPNIGIQDLELANLVNVDSNIPQDIYDDLTFTSSNTGFAVSRTGRIVKTNDGGLTWTILASGVSFSLRKIQFLNSSLGYVIGGDDTGGYMLKTTDSGLSWTITNLNSQVNNSPNSIYFKNELEGFVTGDHLFKKTVDGGVTWSDVFTTTDEDYQDIKFDSENIVGYVTLNNGNYYKTTNGGVSWQSIDVDASLNNYKDIYYVCDNFLFKDNSSVLNVNSSTSVAIPNSIKKLLYLNSNKVIGIGHHSGEGFLTYGDIFLTNNNWLNFSQRSYPSSEAMDFTAIAQMNNHKTMMIGTGELGAKIVTITY